MSDTNWAPLARSSRQALAELGWHIEPLCLPDEAAPCGGTFAEHTMAHLAVIKAIADHQLEHLGTPAEMVAMIRDNALAEITCQKLHPEKTG